MKKIVFALAVLCAVSCSGGDFISRQAVRYTKSYYRDFDRLIMCSIDTVTLGDNLDYRREQASLHVRHSRLFLEEEESYLEQMRKLGGGKDTSSLHECRLSLDKDTAWKSALDSLKGALSNDVLSSITAYNCCVAYNYPNNLVWVQLDANGRLLSITKDRRREWLLNPGEDVPGYFELWERFHDR